MQKKYVYLAKKILEKKGIKYNAYLAEKKRERKMAILEGKDAEWERNTTREICEELVLNELESKFDSTKQHNMNTGEGGK